MVRGLVAPTRSRTRRTPRRKPSCAPSRTFASRLRSRAQGFSPDAQRETIERFAAENDLDLIDEYTDFHSGWRKTDGRRNFHRLMADAAERRFDVVLVFHTSRFARNQVEARKYKQLLRDELGIQVVSVTQPMGEDPNDPSSFLAESIHEMFDEYYSVSLSFWTAPGSPRRPVRAPRRQPPVGLHARRGRPGAPCPTRSARRSCSRCSSAMRPGKSPTEASPAWLNAKGARTTRGRAFGKDTVREMLVNASYCGYVCGLRDKSRRTRGRHEPIVPEELFDRVQEVRSWRTRVVKPGPPSDEYLLRKLLYCERCGERMHGTPRLGRGCRRYVCSTRRYGTACGEPIVKAEPLEAQLIDWIRTFEPDDQLRDLVVAAIRETTTADDPDCARRRELTTQLERLQDLYVMGDMTKPQYVMRRQALEDELERVGPPKDPQLEQAAALLADFSRFWEIEPSHAERRKLLASLFERIWEQGGTIIAVKPRAPFARYFTAAEQLRRHQDQGGAESGSDGT